MPPISDAVGGEELWDFSLKFYAHPGVSEALLALQDRDGSDINLILFALWLGLSGRVPLTDAGLARAAEAIRAISAEIVAPLRALRRKLRSEPDSDVQQLREGVKRLELAAEKAVQHRLARLAGSSVIPLDPAARLAAAAANLALYLGPARADSAAAAALRDALEGFSGAWQD
jgi:uncharacterized protein (TIGR02444 family)